MICVGKNYLKHAQELGDAVPDEAMFFMKPPSSAVYAEKAKTLTLPKGFDVHHEVELVLKIEERDGKWLYTEYTFGLDLTLRDLQTKLKKAGHPWERAKAFKQSAVLGPFRKITNFNELMNSKFGLKVNGETRQEGTPSEMRFKPDELLKDALHWFPVQSGDLLFTGTPEGVGPLKSGDNFTVYGPLINYSMTCGE